MEQKSFKYLSLKPLSAVVHNLYISVSAVSFRHKLLFRFQILTFLFLANKFAKIIFFTDKWDGRSPKRRVLNQFVSSDRPTLFSLV